MPEPRPPRRRGWATAIATVMLTAAGCGSDPVDETDAAGQPNRPDGFQPVTIENCGAVTTYESVPERALPMDQNVTEMLLALGLQDRIAGHARVHFDPSEPVLPEFADVYAELELLGDTEPSREVVLALEPDIALAAFGFSEESGLSVDALRADGISTYLLGDQCDGRTDPVTFDDLYDTLRDLGAIFDVGDRADALISELKATIGAITGPADRDDPPAVLVYDSGEDAPFTVGGTGMGDAIITAAGGVNVFADVDRQFFTASWEEALAADPDMIVIMDYSHGDDGGDVAAKRTVVESRLADTTAVREGRIVDLPLTGFFMSVRNADSVEALAEPMAAAG